MTCYCDTHSHLFFDSYLADLDEVLQKSWENEISRILIPGINLETSEQAVSLSERYPNLYAAVGVHPNEAEEWKGDSLNRLRSLANHPKVVAIGEIGLDYYRNPATQELQKFILKTQMDLASSLKKPIIIHNRQAFTDMWPMLKKWKLELIESHNPLSKAPGVLHSFEGDLPSAVLVTNLHFYIGVSGPVTFRNSTTLQEIAKALPLEKILIETDSPFLTPDPHRGQRNEPSYVIFIAKKISELRAQPLQVVAEITTQNANNLFAWGVAA